MKLSDIAELQPKPWALLARACAANRVAGTYLLSGREGLGHWQLAVSFAALLNCETARAKKLQDQLPVPCGECASCRTIAALNSPALDVVLPIPSHKDLREAIDLTNDSLEEKRKEPFAIISSASQLTVPIDMAREIKRKLSLKGDGQGTRVVLFYQMDKMLAASADALLKLIEEPPADTVIILTANKPEALLPTIRSRAQLIRLDRIPESAIARYLSERYQVPEQKALLYARVTDGNLGRAIDLVLGEEADETSQRATSFLLFKSLFKESPAEAISQAMLFLGDSGRSQAEELLLFWGTLIRDCANYAATGDENQIINSDFSAEIMRLAEHFADVSLAPAMIAALKNALADVRLNVHIQPSIAALSLTFGAAIRATR